LLGIPESKITLGRMSYDLRRLRPHGIIERIPQNQRYRLTQFGLKTALFYTRTYQRLLRPGLSMIHNLGPAPPSDLASAFLKLQTLLDAYLE
jgi:hypothetical protein